MSDKTVEELLQELAEIKGEVLSLIQRLDYAEKYITFLESHVMVGSAPRPQLYVVEGVRVLVSVLPKLQGGVLS